MFNNHAMTEDIARAHHSLRPLCGRNTRDNGGPTTVDGRYTSLGYCLTIYTNRLLTAQV